ncbi:hypothetical protein IH980_03015 [Patescibacteria group bacterium]|nr:hypothetical protein [Patescibacteria group bacterium]
MALNHEAPSATSSGDPVSESPATEISIEQEFTAATAEHVGAQAAATMSLKEQWDMLSNMSPDDFE